MKAMAIVILAVCLMMLIGCDTDPGIVVDANSGKEKPSDGPRPLAGMDRTEALQKLGPPLSNGTFVKETVSCTRPSRIVRIEENRIVDTPYWRTNAEYAECPLVYMYTVRDSQGGTHEVQDNLIVSGIPFAKVTVEEIRDWESGTGAYERHLGTHDWTGLPLDPEERRKFLALNPPGQPISGAPSGVMVKYGPSDFADGKAEAKRLYAGAQVAVSIPPDLIVQPGEEPWWYEGDPAHRWCPYCGSAPYWEKSKKGIPILGQVGYDCGTARLALPPYLIRLSARTPECWTRQRLVWPEGYRRDSEARASEPEPKVESRRPWKRLDALQKFYAYQPKGGGE